MKTETVTLRRLTLATLAAAALAAALPAARAADDFPSHRITFVVPFPPGSGTDTSARYFARKLGELTGQTVVVENKPGANGFLAVKAVQQAPADGYTVFIGSNSTLAVNAALFKQLPYDPVADFTPLSMLMRAPALLIAPNEGAKTLGELIASARAQPGKLAYGAGSAGYQLMAELFNEQAKVETTHIPFKGANEAVVAVGGGQVQLAFVDVGAAQELVKTGRMRGLAVASERRLPALPAVPTAAEAGLPGYTAYIWVAAMVSSKVPRPAADKLAELFTRIERLPETREFYDKLSAETMAGGPAEMRQFQTAEIARWKRIAAAAKVEQQ